jgi:hypothetical protein
VFGYAVAGGAIVLPTGREIAAAIGLRRHGGALSAPNHSLLTSHPRWEGSLG